MRAQYTKDGGMMTPYRSEMIAFDIDTKEALRDDGTFRGYGSTFGDRPDAHGHIIAPGAFQKSLGRGGRNRSGVMMLFGHDATRIPGVWTDLREDKKGLYNEGQLFVGMDGTPLGKEVYVLLKNKAIQHESIGFDLPRDKNGGIKPSAIEKDEAKGITYLKEIELFEISLVAFPANVDAQVTRVKEEVQEALFSAKTEREFEAALRESGLSKTAALYVTKLAKPSLRELERVGLEGGDAELILNALRQMNSSLCS